MAFVMALLLLGGFLARPGGGASASADGSHSRQVDAPPAAVVAALRASMSADGLQLVSRADNGDHYRQLVPAYETARDPKYAELSRFGDMIVTARVHDGGAEVHTGFTSMDTAADFTITVAAREAGQGSVVTVAGEVEQGTGDDAERIAERLRATIDGQSREILGRIVANVRRQGA